MRKLGRTASDSLDLLLDTVCNMFGVILLIAILVTLLTQTIPATPASDNSTAEILQRKIATAESDLADAIRLRDESAKGIDPKLVMLSSETLQLRQAIDQARSRLEQVDAKIHDQVVAQTFDFTSESAKLSQQLLEAERKQTELANTIKTDDQNTARLRSRSSALTQQTQQTKEARVTKLRFPKERTGTKDTFSIIVKYNQVYPLYNQNLDKNTETISWTPSVLSDSETAVPINGKGLDLVRDRAGIVRFLQAVPTADYYVAFYVYTDSFDAFHSLREMAVQAGFEFGWEPVQPGVQLRFGKGGHSPPPL